MDRKYEYTAAGLRHREGDYIVPHDEPQCTLRAKDPDTIAALLAYIEQSDKVFTETGDVQAKAHADGARQTLLEFQTWQKENPSRVKRGCHECG